MRETASVLVIRSGRARPALLGGEPDGTNQVECRHPSQRQQRPGGVLSLRTAFLASGGHGRDVGRIANPPSPDAIAGSLKLTPCKMRRTRAAALVNRLYRLFPTDGDVPAR